MTSFNAPGHHPLDADGRQGESIMTRLPSMEGANRSQSSPAFSRSMRSVIYSARFWIALSGSLAVALVPWGSARKSSDPSPVHASSPRPLEVESGDVHPRFALDDSFETREVPASQLYDYLVKIFGDGKLIREIEKNFFASRAVPSVTEVTHEGQKIFVTYRIAPEQGTFRTIVTLDFSYPDSFSLQQYRVVFEHLWGDMAGKIPDDTQVSLFRMNSVPEMRDTVSTSPDGTYAPDAHGCSYDAGHPQAMEFSLLPDGSGSFVPRSPELEFAKCVLDRTGRLFGEPGGDAPLQVPTGKSLLIPVLIDRPDSSSPVQALSATFFHEASSQ